MRTFIYRFTSDLRLDDHAGLATAAASGEIVPVLVLDRVVDERLTRSPRRAAFFCRCVAALDASLRERGARLLVRRGSPGAVLKSVARASGAGGVAWSASYDATGMARDARLQSELEEAGLSATIVHDAPAIAPEETAAAREDGLGYRAFAPYFETWRMLAVASHEAPLLMRFATSELQSEALPVPADFGSSATAHDAGERAANEALREFLSRKSVQYSLAMNVPSEDATSRLSAHFSFGTLSARSVVRAVAERAEDPFLLSEERASLRLFLRSIALRDFFLQLGWFSADAGDGPLQEKMRGFTFARSHPALDAWREGKTGFPLVDAGVRQLRETGWMHPHVRAVAASFLCFDLGVDWRVGRDEWDRHLVEDDVALATGNWQWVAGVGADMAQYPRIYNPQKQQRRFDPLGTYVRTHIPELARLPIDSWPISRHTGPQMNLPLFADEGYPAPILDHTQSAQTFLSRYRTHQKKQP